MKGFENLKKGDTVILCVFTGLPVAIKEVVDVSKTTVTIKTRKGKDMKFMKATGIQISSEPNKYANFIKPDDGSYKPKNADNKQPVKTTTTKSKKTTKKVVDKDDDDEYEEV